MRVRLRPARARTGVPQRRAAPGHVAARRGTTIVTVAALLAAQLAYLGVQPAAPASAAPAGAGSAFDCTGTTAYAVQPGANGDPATLQALDTGTLGGASVSATHVADLPAGADPDALGLTAGQAAAVDHAAAGTSVPLHVYDAATATWTTTSGSAAAGDTFAAGAVDPSSHVYYYAAFAGSTATIYGYDLAGSTAIPGAVATVALPIGGSGTADGDLAFDRDGDLYLVESRGSQLALAEVDGPLPTSGGGAALTATTLQTYANPAGHDVDGIAFDNAGRLLVQYIDGATTRLEALNPNTGAVLAGPTDEGVAGATDLAACSLNPTLRAQAGVTARSGAGDQFHLSITGGSVTTHNTATTTGTATGVQPAVAGPVVGVSGTTYTVTETAAAGQLSDYAVTYRCTDAADSDAVVAQGSGASVDLDLPDAADGSTGPSVTCRFTNTPTPAALHTTVTVQSVNGAAPGAGSTVAAGDVIAYDIATTNTGGTSGTATLTDHVPAGTTYTADAEGWTGCPTGAAAGTACTQPVTVAPGATVHTAFTVTVGSAGATAVRDTVTASDGSCAACTAIYPTVPLLDTALGVQSVNGDTSATAGTPLRAGDTVVYAVRVTNSGGAAGSTVLTQTVPAHATYTGSGEGWTCSAPAAGSTCTQTVAVPLGDSTTVHYTVTLGALPAGTQHVDDTVSTGTGTCSACTLANPTAALLDTGVTVTTVNGGPADASTAVGSGDEISYTITTTNTGATAGTATLSDPVPPHTTYSGTGWSCPSGAVAGTACTAPVSVAPGASVTTTYTVTVAALPAGTSTISDIVTVDHGGCSACTAALPTVGALDTTAAPATVNGKPADATTPVGPGDVLGYAITTTNSGGAPATTTLSATVPAHTGYTGTGWTCPGGGDPCTQAVTVPAGATVTRVFTVTVGALPAGTTTIDGAVTSSAGTCSACAPSNPTVAVLDTTLAVQTVDGSPATAATPVGAGDTVTYRATVTNTGGSDADTVLTETVPAHTTYAGTGWSCSTGDPAGTTCTRTVSVAAGSSAHADFAVQATTPLPRGTLTIDDAVTTGTGSCSACTASNPTAPQLGTALTLATVNGQPATASTPVGAGDELGYRITVTNTGGSSGTTTLTDTVPASAAYSGSAEGWSCAAGAPAGTDCTQLVTVVADDSTTVGFTVTLGALPTGTTTVTDEVAASTGTCSACSATNPTTAVLSTVLTLQAVNGDASATDSTPVGAGDTLTYTATTTNSGGSTGTTTLSDAVPAGTRYSGAAAEGWSCATGSTAGTLCLQPISVPAGGSGVARPFTVTVVTPLPTGTQTIGDSLAATAGTCASCTISNPTVADLDTVKQLVSVNGTAATSSTALTTGDVVAYRIVVTNTGGSSGSTTLTDAVPAHTTYTGAATEGWSCPAGSAAGTACTQAVTVPADSATPVDYTLTVGPLPAGTTTVANAVTTSTGSCSACGVSSPTAAVLSTVKALATVNGATATSSAQVRPGDVLGYTLTTTNSGGSSGTTTLSDPVPANTVYSGAPSAGWSCVGAAPAGTGCTQDVTVPAGGTAVRTYTVTVGALPSGTAAVTNQATSSAGACAACTVSTPTVAVLDTVKTVAAINGDPTATAATQVTAGDVIDYSITVTNTGGSTGSTTLSDPVPAHTTYSGAAADGWSCGAGAPAGRTCLQTVGVAAGAAVTVDYTVTVTTPLAPGTATIGNTVTTSAGTCSACSVSNPTVPVLDTVKTVSTVNGAPATAATRVTAGDVLGYTITVTNTGGSTGTTTLNDAVPADTTYDDTGAGWSCADGAAAGTACTLDVAVAAGTSVTTAYQVTVDTPLPAGTQAIANTVTTSAGTCSACSVSNPTIPVLDTALTIGSINGDATATTATQVTAGDKIAYSISVTNSGGSAGSTTLTETVPANTAYSGSSSTWTCSAKAAGSTCTRTVPVAAAGTATVTFAVTVATPLAKGTQTIDDAVATSSGTCSACAVSNPTVAALDTVKTIASVNGDASATSATRIAPGDRIVYTLTVTNSGGSPGTTTLTDDVPDNTTYTGSGEGWTCADGTCTQDVAVPAAGTVSVTYSVTVDDPLPSGTQQISNTVTTSAGTCSACTVANPTVPVLNTTKAIVSVNGRSASTATPIGAGDVVVYRVRVTNSGGSPGTTTVTDTVPAHTAYTGTGEGWTCAAGSCTQDITAPADDAASRTFTVTVAAPLTTGTQTISNTVTTTAGTCMACTVTNPTAPVLDTVKTLASVDGDTAATPATQVQAGDVLVYALTVSNSGGSTGSTTLTDTVPANTTYSGTGEGWSCASGAAAGTACTQQVSVGAATSVTRTFTVTVGALPSGTRTVANTAASSTGTCSACSVVNPTVASLHTVKQMIDVDGDPATAATQVGPGAVLLYGITVTNTGGSPGTTTLTDSVPADSTYTGDAEGWTCPQRTAGAPCTQSVTVAPGGSVAKTFTMTLVRPLPTGLQTVANTVATTSGTCQPCSVVNPTVGTLSVAKTVTRINGAPATTADPVQAGDVVRYAITAVNSGGADVTTLLSDPVPAGTTYTGTGEGWSCRAPAPAGAGCTQSVVVAKNSTVTVTYTVTVSDRLPRGTASIDNTVTTSQGSCTACMASSPTVAALDTTAKLTTVDGRMLTGAARVPAGAVLGYTLTVTNTGGLPLTTVLADRVPQYARYTGAGEGWSCGSPAAAASACAQAVLVPAQSSVAVRYTLTVDRPLPSVARAITDVVTTSQGSCSACTVAAPLQVADVVVTKTADRTRSTIGGRLGFTVRVRNNGPDAASGVTVQDRPTGLDLDSSVVTQGRFERSGRWTVGVLASGTVAVLHTVYTVRSRTVTNSAQAGNTAQVDPDGPNGSAAVSVAVAPGGPDSLASTGLPTLALLRVALLLLLGGVALLAGTRRRRRASA